MGQAFIGEIRMFAGNFAPTGWHLCDGALMSIAENDVLFTLIGTTYGGDGENTFALPDLQSRVPMHQGSGFIIGQSGGEESVTLTTNQIPIHTHAATCLSGTNTGSAASPGGNIWASQASVAVYANQPPTANMNPGAVAVAGSSQPHDNMIPYLAINFIIALYGLFPRQT